MKGRRDPKFLILPSTTRKGTALNSKATLDSPTILNRLVTPPANTGPTVDASLAESATASDEFDDASIMLDDYGSLGPFLDTLIANTEKITNLDERLITPASSPELYNYESRYPNDSYIDVNDEFIRQYMNCEASGDPDA